MISFVRLLQTSRHSACLFLLLRIRGSSACRDDGYFPSRVEGLERLEWRCIDFRLVFALETRHGHCRSPGNYVYANSLAQGKLSIANFL